MGAPTALPPGILVVVVVSGVQRAILNRFPGSTGYLWIASAMIRDPQGFLPREEVVGLLGNNALQINSRQEADAGKGFCHGRGDVFFLDDWRKLVPPSRTLPHRWGGGQRGWPKN
jgi:hypothetical protein